MQSIRTSQGAMTASQLREQLIARASDDEAFRARLLDDPRALLRDDYEISLPESLKLHVHEEDATTAHLVLPRSSKLTEAELEASTGAGRYY